MLSELVVHNFAIIRHLEISFQSGLNVLSGETGAGKSILVGAVNLILGSRASQEMIRTGAGEAMVEAVFKLPESPGLMARLRETGLDLSEDLLVRRSISRSGRNRIFINDQAVTLQQLQQLARGLVSVSGQHEHQLLMDPEVHLGLLDSFGDLDPVCQAVGLVHARWAEMREKLSRLRKAKQEQATKLDYMRFQLQDLESANLQPDEDKALEQELSILRHAATLREAAERSYGSLYAGKGAILEQLAEVEKNLQTLTRIDPSQESLLSHLEQARIHLDEMAHGLQHYAHHVQFDPQRLSAVEDRLAALQRLGKKYGGSLEAMLEHLGALKKALGHDGDVELQEEEMVKALEKLRKEYLDSATELSRRRREAAERLGMEVEKTLAAVDMQRARFAVSFAREVGLGGGNGSGKAAEPPFTPTGIDRVEFLLSANPGEEMKPLVKVASGGELSRILLALKSLLSRRGEAETLIFDEVDTGIGGRTAELVGLQLKRLACRHQVICITHLPQIACYGEYHYKVAKETDGNETTTNILCLGTKERVEELSRMLGGIAISEKTRAHAREMLNRGQKGI